MYKNYFKLALRHLLKNKIYAAINIIGLAVALSSTFYILVYVINEFSYDDCHLKNERIYKVINHKIDFGIKRVSSPYVFAPVVKERFPEIEKISRTRHLRAVKVKHNGELLNQGWFLTAENDLFEIFTLPILKGTNNIEDKNSIVISESTAKKYFGDQNPINKTLDIEAKKIKFTCKIVGVMMDIPQNSTLKAEIIGNTQLYLEQLKNIIADPETDWLADFWVTYILLNNTENAEKVEDGLRKIVDDYYPIDSDVNEEFLLKNLKGVYFDEELIGARHGSLDDVYLYIAIGFLILLFAASNYTILSSAISNNRAKEIGIRKTVGATKKNLVFQFLGESILLTFLALVLAIILIEIFNTYAQELFNYDFEILKTNISKYMFAFLVIAATIGTISGMYVAIYLSSLNITEIVKNTLILKNKGRLRKILILIQFISFIILVFSSIVIYKQHTYFLNKDLGFNKDNLLFVYADFDLLPWINGYIDKIYSNTNIKNVSYSTSQIPTNGGSYGLLRKYDDPSQKVEVEMLSVGPNFIETMGIKIIEGENLIDKNYVKNYSTNNKDVIFNKAVIDALGIKDPIGKKIEVMTIVGIFKEFNLHSLHSKINPLGIRFTIPKYVNTIIVRYKDGKLESTIDYLKTEWKNFTENEPFDYETIEEVISQLYEDEETLFKIVSFFTILAILLAASGLFGLTLFTLKKRIKEFGVRRVLGASILNIFFSISKEFLVLLVIAGVIALPIAYFLMHKWLEDFAYKTNIGIYPAVVTGFFIIIIVIGAISIQTFKAALTNPIESLRDE